MDAAYPRLAESSDDSEPMFAYEDREVPVAACVDGRRTEIRATEGEASEAADAGTCRLMAGPDRWTVSTLGEDGGAGLEVLAYRPQPRARSPRELWSVSTRPRPEDSLPSALNL